MPAWPPSALADFLPGPESKLAVNAAVRTAAEPGTRYNPLFLHGPAGAGKSHLLFGLAHALAGRGLKRTLAMTAGHFAEWCDAAWRTRNTPELRHRLWSADALLIDDVHLLPGRPAALEELYHAYNRLMADGKQLVFASAKSPGQLLELAVPMRNRFLAGLVVGVETPGPGTLRSLLAQQSQKQGLVLTRPAADLLAERLRSPRETLGLVASLAGTYAKGSAGRRIGLEKVRQFLEGYGARRITIGDIAHAVSAFYHVPLARLRSGSRVQTLAQARQLAMYLCRELTKAPLMEIGSYFGGRDHSTVLYAARKAEDLVGTDAGWARAARTLRRQLAEG